MADFAAYQCPQCGSDNTQRLSVIHEQGTSQGKISGMSISSDLSVGVGGGTIGHQSELAKKFAPPKLETDQFTGQMMVAGCFCTLLLPCGLGSMFLLPIKEWGASPIPLLLLGGIAAVVFQCSGCLR